MPKRFDPIYNDDDRHTQHRWDDERDRTRREPGGTDHVPESPFVPSSGSASDPYTPPEAVRDQWRKTYASMSVEELRAEQDELYDELLELAGLPYVDEHGHGMNEMKRDLIRERLRRFPAERRDRATRTDG